MSHFINLQLNVEGAQAERTLGRFTQNIEAAVKASNGIGTTNKRNQQTSREFFGSQIKSMGQMALGFAGVGTAIGGIATVAGLLRAEYDNLIEREQNSANALRGRAALEAELITNSTTATELGATPGERGQNILKLRDAFSETLGISQTKFTPIASQAASSRGNLDLPTAFSVAGLSFLTAGGDQNTAQARTSLGLGLAQGGIPFDAGVGFGIAAGQSLPISNSEQIASALGKTIPAGLATGATAPETTGVFAALSGAINDTEGRRSGTAALQLLAILDKLAPKLDRPEDQIQFIRDNPEKFADQTSLSKLSGETAFKPLFQSLLRGGSDVGDQLFSRFKAVRDDLPTLEKAGQIGRDSLEALSQSDAIKLEALGSRVNQIVESAQSGDVTGAEASVSREGLQEILKSHGFSSFTQRAAGIGFDASVEIGGADPVDALSTSLRSQAARLEKGRTFTVGGGYGAPEYQRTVAPTELELERAASLKQAATLLNNDDILGKLDKLIETVATKPIAQTPLSKRQDVRTPPSDRPSQALLN